MYTCMCLHIFARYSAGWFDDWVLISKLSSIHAACVLVGVWWTLFTPALSVESTLYLHMHTCRPWYLSLPVCVRLRLRLCLRLCLRLRLRVSASASASTYACVCAQELEDAATANSSALSSASAGLLETARREAAQNRISADELSVQLEVRRLIIESCHTSEGLSSLVSRLLSLASCLPNDSLASHICMRYVAHMQNRETHNNVSMMNLDT